MDEYANPNVEEEESVGNSLLSFRPLGRVLEIDELSAEFDLMRNEFKNQDDFAAKFGLIGRMSGTHVLKAITPKADIKENILRFHRPGQNCRDQLIPSHNAPDIPYSKVVYRPLEIRERQPRSLVDYVINPDEISDLVKAAFASAFGRGSLDALVEGLAAAVGVNDLPDAEFPIIFLPDGEGGDIQVTPISPAALYPDMRKVTGLYFRKQAKDGPKVPRGQWHRQIFTGKMQNVSGALSKERVRILARMPTLMRDAEAELLRFVRGGIFPRLRSGSTKDWLLRYVDMLAASESYHNKDTRDALDRVADGLAKTAIEFIAETMEEARILAEGLDEKPASLDAPSVTTVLKGVKGLTSLERQKVEQAILHPDFARRKLLMIEKMGA